MRIHRAIALGLAFGFAAPLVSPAGALDAPDGIVVADNRGRDAKDKSWKRAPDWARRNLHPRVIERATRDALRSLEPIEPAPRTTQSIPRTPASAPTAPEPTTAAAAVAEPAAAPATPPPAPIGPPASTRVTLRSVAAATALTALVAAFVLARRRERRGLHSTELAAPVALLALPAGTAIPVHTPATRVRTAIDVAVATAIAVHDRGAAAQPFPGGGRYEILEEIGRGGMGVVYKARDKRLDRVVALKRLPDTLESEPRYVELLLREARSAARLNHRNIVTVHDVDREGDSWFITMEHLEGRPLAALLSKHGRIAPRSLVWLGEQIVAGLGYAHERGIVHRDVKPANLFLTNDRTLKLMDFGVAKILEEARRRRTLIGGTPAYMAPEQATGETVDGRADLYALGATFFELLTGQLPFAQGDALHHHRATQAPDPRERAAGIPDALAELVLALMRKHPDERPASAADVAARLQAIAATYKAARSVA